MPEYLKRSVITEEQITVTLESLCKGITLCVFLRHWGCAECSLLLHRLSPRFRELLTLDVRVILIGLGSPEGIETFRTKHRFTKDEVIIVTDPTLALHQSAGLSRGTIQVSGPSAMLNRIKFKLQGFTNQVGDGDTLQQGGAILLNASHEEIWGHRNAYFGDVLDPIEMFNTALRESAQS